MKAIFSILIIIALHLTLGINNAQAQCSVCTKTVAQMGEKPAEGLNTGILYLMFAPFAIVGVVGYRWWKSNGQAGGTD
ncbi:MAG: hypothetical protein JST86_02300 [Bacteroidetes bacterium]|nr:hypothetical protein [Bacteroidota bacterium]